jgi:hypothetical protein
MQESAEYINDLQVFGSEEECLQEFDFCWERKNKRKESEWLKECPPHKLKIGFVCVPICLTEMPEELKASLAEEKGYCVEDIIDTGLPFYDLS